MTNLTEALNQASANAAATPATPAQAEPVHQVAHAQNTGVAVAAPAMTMETAATSGMAVDAFIKMGDDCVEVDKVKYPEVKVHMITRDGSQGGSFVPFIGLNYEIVSGNFKYTKTYNGQTVSEGDHVGKSWAQHVSDIQAQAPNAKPFNGYNLFMVVAEDTQPVKKGEKVLAKGTVLGFSTTATSSRTALSIWQRAQRDGRLGDTAIVLVRGVERENGNKQKYKTLAAEFLGYDEDNHGE